MSAVAAPRSSRARSARRAPVRVSVTSALLILACAAVLIGIVTLQVAVLQLNSERGDLQSKRDTLTSSIQAGFGNGTVPGGWPNGRRFGDDVVDIAVTALISDLRVSPPVIRGPAGDNVDRNDMAYNKVFPYESTPQNGRNHAHP